VEGGSGEPFLGHRVRAVLGGIADTFFFVSLALALAGLRSFLRDRRADRIFVLCAIVTLVGVPMLLWGSTRFHIPLLPFMAISGASAIAAVARRVTPFREFAS
jgi:asparagine N-glycosylation enzyme membrane subunit Stt3